MSHPVKAESRVTFDLWNALPYARFLHRLPAHRPSVITLLLSWRGCTGLYRAVGDHHSFVEMTVKNKLFCPGKS